MLIRSAVLWYTGILILSIASHAKSMPYQQPYEGNPEDIDNVEMDNEDYDEDLDEELENDLFQGDIVQDPIDPDVRNQGILQNETWPGGIVPYRIHGSIRNNPSKLQMIKEAMAEIESVSCIEFKEHNQRTGFYVKIYGSHDGLCHSAVGKRTADIYMNIGQPLRLDEQCFNKGTILHELMHTIGFNHEQARTDRDDFVNINFENVNNNDHKNFDKTNDHEVTHLDTTYDYSSIMHYHWNAFAIDKNKPTITVHKRCVNENFVGFGKADKLSPTDKIEINRLYNCPAPNGPSVPEKIQCRESDTAVNISWELPKVNNEEVKGYEIIYTDDSSLPQDEWESVLVSGSHERSHKITGLGRSTEYTIRIRTKTDDGPGQFSEPCDVTTTLSLNRRVTCRPTAPKITRCIAKMYEIQINWNPPETTNGEIIGYEIFYTDDSSSAPIDDWISVYLSRSETRQSIIDDLNDDITYNFHIRAINEHGPGLLSDLFSAKTRSSTVGKVFAEEV